MGHYFLDTQYVIKYGFYGRGLVYIIYYITYRFDFRHNLFRLSLLVLNWNSGNLLKQTRNNYSTNKDKLSKKQQQKDNKVIDNIIKTDTQTNEKKISLQTGFSVKKKVFHHTEVSFLDKIYWPLFTVCPGSSDPLYIVTYYIKWVTTFWTHSTLKIPLFLDLVWPCFAPLPIFGPSCFLFWKKIVWW